MITITLQKIKDNGPCSGGWRKVLKAHEHLGMDTEFPLSSVIESNGLYDAVWCIRCLPQYRNLWTKFGIWCARQVECLMQDSRCAYALGVSWNHTNDLATDEEVSSAKNSVMRYLVDAGFVGRDLPSAAAVAWSASTILGNKFSVAANRIYYAVTYAIKTIPEDERAQAREAQKNKLIEIITAGEWVGEA